MCINVYEGKLLKIDEQISKIILKKGKKDRDGKQAI